MTDDLPLFAAHSVDPAWLVRPTSQIEWDFKRYHDANPHVYQRLETAALRWADSNAKRVGVKRLAENLRYSTVGIKEPPHAPFKINNNHTALFARLLIHRHPRLAGVIELRVRKEDGASAA
jgi:hypothetical protein